MLSLREILPQIFHVHLKSGYDLASLFLRYQEYYESPNPRFRGQIGWSILEDYAPWYAKTYGKGTFNYHSSWSGFNIPGTVLDSHFLAGNRPSIPDLSRYDLLMESIYWIIRGALPEADAKFYLIGTSAKGFRGDGDVEGVLSHEIAHGLYYTTPAYKTDVEKLLSEMDADAFSAAKKVLADMGYDAATQVDEVHAYASTGLTEKLEPILTSEICTPFLENFTRWLEKMAEAKLHSVQQER